MIILKNATRLFHRVLEFRYYIFILIRLLSYHICEVPWAHTQEIIFFKSCEIRLYQAETIDIMKGSKYVFIFHFCSCPDNSVFIFLMIQ